MCNKLPQWSHNTQHQYIYYLDGLVGLAADQPRAGLVELHLEDAGLGVEGARLDRGLWGGGGQGRALRDHCSLITDHDQIFSLDTRVFQPQESYLEPLEVVPRLPVPEVHRPVVRPGHQHPVGVGGEAVDDGVVARQVLDELALGTFPLLDVVGAAAGEHQQLGVGHLGWGGGRSRRI